MWSTSDKHYLSRVRYDCDRALDLATAPETLTAYGHELLAMHRRFLDHDLPVCASLFGPNTPIVARIVEAQDALDWRIRLGT